MKKIILFIIIIELFSFIFASENSEKRTFENLKAFTKMYGYIRFFHPSDEAQEINWDKFAVYGVSEVIKARNDQELIMILSNLFSPIAPTAMVYQKNKKLISSKIFYIPKEKERFKTTFWQYNGLGITNPLFESRRTNRLYKIKKKEDLEISHAKLILDTKLSERADSVIVSFKYKYNSPITSQNYITASHNNLDSDHQKWEKVNNNNWNFVSFNFDRQWIKKTRFNIFFIDANSILIDSIQIREKIQGSYIINKSFNFKSEIPGQHPYTISYSGVYPDFLRNLDYTIVENENKRFLLIEKSQNQLDYTFSNLNNIFEDSLKIDTHIDRSLNKKLNLYSPLVLYCNSEHSYPIADSINLTSLIKNLNKIELTNSSAENRIASVVIFWNLIQHFFPYFEYLDIDWEKELDKALHKSLQIEHDKGFSKRGYGEVLNSSQEVNKDKSTLFLIKEMGSKLKDSHFFADKVSLINKEMPPFAVNYIENKWIITDICKNVDLALGSEIIEYNSQRFEQIYKDFNKYFIGASTQGDKHSFFRDYNRYNDSSQNSLKIKTPDNLICTKEINSQVFNGYDLDLKRDSLIVYSDSLLYLNINVGRLNDNDIKRLIPLIKKAKGIIFDLRLYPNVNTGILSYLLTDKIDYVSGYEINTLFPDQNPAPVKKKYEGMFLFPDSIHIDAKCVFLSGELSQSYCETYLSIAKHYKLATIIGSRTNATNGNVIDYQLPLGIDIRWTGYFIKNFDGSRFHGIGVIPDIEVKQTINGIQEERDEVLEKALEFLRQR